MKNELMKWIAGLLAIASVAFFVGRLSVGGFPFLASETEEETEEADLQEYTCPMHAQIRQQGPGICPICEMDLIVAEDVDAVQLSEGARRMARVENDYVEAGAVGGNLGVYGEIDVDEEAEVDLTAWTGGRIEQLNVSATGERVRRGELLARIYSPELLSAQRTLLQALENKRDAEESESERRLRAAQSSLEAARTELRLLGVDSRQIEEIEETGEARETVDVFATASGTVRTRHVTEGDYVSTGDPILSLAPLDTVWAQLEIYERDLPRVSEGMPVTVEVPALDGESFDGRVAFLAPDIDDRKRIARARVVLSNEDGRLRPGMYVRGRIEVSVGDEETLSVPKSAVLWTGQRSLVYQYDRQIEPPGYVPKPVTLGPRIGDRYVIEEGLEAGDEVASRGAFRLDAELQITGGPTMMSAMHADGDSGAQSSGGDEPVEVPEAGVEFDPPVDPDRLPDDVWFCDMGTTHWAQHEEGDGSCPVCGMGLTHKESENDEGGDAEQEEHDHEH